MKKISIQFFLLLSILVASSWQLWAADPSVATATYDQALSAETGSRDLDKAIELYQKVIDESSNQPGLAGKARFRMAECYERLGQNDQAQKLYQQIIAQPTGIALDLVSDSQANYDRLQKQANQTSETISPPAPPSFPRWALDLEGGYSISQNAEFPQQHTQADIWGSVGYRLTRLWQMGLESGYILPKSSTQNTTDNDEFFENQETLTTKYSNFYIGPYLQGTVETKRVDFFARLGAGISEINGDLDLKETTHAIGCDPATAGLESPCTNTFDQTATAHETDAAVASSIGFEVKLNQNWAAGLGFRDLMVFRHEAEISETQSETGSITTNISEPLKVSNLLMPFARISLSF